MTHDTALASFYRVLAAIGFDEPTLGGKGMPTIAWPDTQTGITLPAEDAPDGWETAAVEADELDVVDSLIERLLLLRDDPVEAERLDVESRRRRRPERDEMTQLGDLPADAIYRTLRHCGFPRPVIGSEGLPTISWPQSRRGIAFPHDQVPDDWMAITLSSPELSRLDRLLSRLSLLCITHRMKASGASATRRISKVEQGMLSALFRHGVPDPNRNFSVHDAEGRFRGVADFAWETINGVPVKVVLEVDGWHWHVGKDLADEIAAAANRNKTVAKQIQQSVRAKGAVDAAKRRTLQMQGWQVIVVHDTELMDENNVDAIAADIRAAIDTRRDEANALAGAMSTPTPKDEF
jgi:G:T-mismatch repair DNA endonuclease (very short patch repair protein)